jgi:hypothetical protein
MLLIIALTVWLILLLLFVALCRMAAYKDGRADSASERLSCEPFTVARTVAAGLTVWEEQPAAALRERSDLRLRVPVAR